MNMFCQQVKNVSGIAAASVHRQRRRHRQRMRLVGQAVFRVTAADHERADLVADFPVRHVRSHAATSPAISRPGMSVAPLGGG
jgi:hypothetical protein